MQLLDLVLALLIHDLYIWVFVMGFVASTSEIVLTGVRKPS